MPDYRYFLFGAPRLEYQNQPVAIDTRKALALLAYLLIEGKPQSRDTLAALLWPESNQTSARAALRRTLSTLRSSLQAGLFDFGRELIAMQPDSDLWCDVLDFRAHLEMCRTHGHGEDQVCEICLTPLQSAADLYTADFMTGFSLRDSAEFDDWQFFTSDRLRRELMSVLERLVNLFQMQNNFSTAIEHARRWLALDALNESAHRVLIALYAQSEQRNAALRQYRECVRILDEELGVAPLSETTQLYEAVKENRVEQEILREQFSFSSIQTIADIHQPLPSVNPPPLVGRTEEWDTLTKKYDTLHQDGVFVALTGEVGIGKTRLAEEFIQHLRARGALTLSAQAYAGEHNLPYAPIIDLIRQGLSLANGKPWWGELHPGWLAEASMLAPELTALLPDVPSRPLSEGPGAQTRFYEGVCQTLTALVSGPLPGLIFIDDVHWADESTQELLAYFVRRLQGRPLLIIVAWQSENTPTIASLEQILNDLGQPDHRLHLALSALSPEHSLALIEQLENRDLPLPSSFNRQLVEASQGLPYFLVEYLQAAREGEISQDGTSSHWPVPAGLRRLIHSRLANLSGQALQILQAAAVIGRTFESDLLQWTSGRSEEEIIQGIEELLARNLIREVPFQTGTNRALASYDFLQEQVRDLVLEDISLVRRRLLHRRIAETLVERSRLPSQRCQCGQIAYHFQQAGLTEQAAEYYFQAGQIDRAVHANADALAHFQAALALGYPDKPAILAEIGDIHTLNGDYLPAIQQYEAAAAICPTEMLPGIERKIGHVYMRRGYWEQAACHFEAALYDLEALPEEYQKAFEAEVRVDWSLAYYRQGKTEQSLSLAQSALDLAESSADPQALAQVHNLLGVLARAGGQPELALEHLSQSSTYARQLDNPGAQIAALNNMALVQADQGQYEQALATLHEALEMCLTLGDRHLEAALRNNLADLLRANHQDDAALLELKQAVAIFAEIGQKVNEWEPEIWKLVEW